MKAPLPENEAHRLAILRNYNVLDSMPEQAFDDLALLAAQICQTPIALISLIDEDRQWFKSKIGLSASETSRDVAFCAHAILNMGEVLEVRDAQLDPRFADNPYVTADPNIRFYIGAPLVTPDGLALGTLCAVDYVPRVMSPEQKLALSALSRTVMAQLELRRTAQRREAEKQSNTSGLAGKKKWSLENATLATFWVAALALLIVGTLSIRSLFELGRQMDAVQHSYQVIEQTGHLLTNMINVQSGQRGYIITGLDEFLDSYNGSRLAAQQAVQELRRLTADNPARQQHIDELEQQVARRLNLAHELIEVRRTQGFKAAQELVTLGVGKMAMDQIRQALNNIEAEEQQQLAERNQRKQDSIRLTLASIGIFGGLAIFVVGFAGVRIRREILLRSAERSRIEMLNADLESRAVELAAARHRAETSELFKSAILEQAGHAIISTTPDGIITTFNHTAERMLGYTAKEMVGLLTPALFHDPAEIAARAQEFSTELGVAIEPGFEVFVAKARRNLPNEYEWTYIGKNGTRLPVLLTVTALRDMAGAITGFLGMAVDITERKLADERFQRVVEASPSGIVIVNQAGTITLVNAQTEKLFGYARQELIGLEVEVLVPEQFRAAHPAQRASFTANPQWRVMGTGRDLYGRRKDGSEFPLEIGLSPLSTPEGMAVLATVADITERKQAEKLLRAKNEELKTFAYTVSHDLKAPLRGVVGYAQELERRHKEGLTERAQFCITQIITASRNLDNLIEDLLKYSRLDTETPTQTKVQLLDIVQNILKDRSLTITELGVEISVTIPPLTLTTWERGLHQVLANLIDNAIKYSRQSQPPRLTIQAEAADGRCHISVADNGIGFDMKYHDRIFGLFNRLVRADEFEGTGVGLAIVKKLVEKFGGTIHAESEPGKGATFFVELPVLHEG